MKTSVTKVVKFETAHQLTNSYSKECQEVHGHSYQCEVTLTGDIDPKTGMIIDFKIISEALKPIVEKYDHKFFTEETFGLNPTAENMAMDIFYTIQKHPKIGVLLTKVKLWETDTCCFEVRY